MIRRFFHNALQTLKKDSSAHFTYNLGVSFVRLGAGLLGAAVILWFVFIFNPLDLLLYRSDTQAVIYDMHVETIEHTGSRGGIHTTYIYHVCFNTDVAGTHVYVDQTIPGSVFDTYEEMGGKGVYLDVKLYKSQKTGLYVSRRGWFLAQLEYGRAHPATTAGIIALICAGLSFIAISAGLREERLAMKYPRTDVEIGATGLVAEDDETNDLLKEFDEAYEKFKANKAAGLPTSEPPRRRKDNDEEETLRLEKKE